MAYQIETTCICGDPETSKNHSFGAVSVPIYQTATFAHPGIGESTGHNYTRESNPTRDELEKTVSALEGVVDTVACTSGMAAISLMMELFDSGSHFVCTEDLYGGSVRIFEALEKKRGFSFSYVNTADVEAVEKAITDQTKALYIETPSNPTMQVTDLAEMSRLATKHGLLLIVDNPFLSPYLQNPIAQGAGEQRGGYRAVAVDDVKAPLFERIHQLRRERQPRAVAHKLRHVDARIAQHRKIEHGVVRVGIKRRHDRGIAEPVLNYFCVICDGIRHAVYGRWERIVYEADVELVHTRLLSGEIVLKLYPNQAQMQAKNQGLNFFLIVS